MQAIAPLTARSVGIAPTVCMHTQVNAEGSRVLLLRIFNVTWNVELGVKGRTEATVR